MYQTEQVTFILHNEQHIVNVSEITPETTLVQYLRDYEHLKGTKYMCLEGGCGTCIVAVTTNHPLTNKKITFAVNSCLVSIFSCQDWTIHTIDGIGNEKIGYHPIQTTLANFNGTQCGFCSPGMVMNMYPLYNSKNVSKKDVEDSFGGNLCRCTGYRPILSAFKSLVANTTRSARVSNEYPDIEDLEKCGRTRGRWSKRCSLFGLSSIQSQWYKVNSVNEIFDVFDLNPGKFYRLVAGNTARGVYHPTHNPDIYIDVTSVANLIDDTTTHNSLIVGANKGLNDTIDLFRKTAKNKTNFAYLDKLADHIELVAHVPVRNIGTLAGNLSIKHEHNEFPSDVFLILTTVDAKLTIVKSKLTEKQYSLTNYLSLDMHKRVIKKIVLPSLGSSYKYGSYKIMPRAQNAHAMVNAGFLIKLDRAQTVQSANIIYGGINPTFVHATKAEQYLIGKPLFDNKTLQGVFSALNDEIQPNLDPPAPSPTFRKKLAISLFYKFVLSITPDNKLSPQNKSGGTLLTRPISTGIQEFQSNESKYPLTEPIPKLGAEKQTSGEVEYISDMPESYNELYAYFVVAKTQANSIIQKIDPSEALKLDGVVKFFDKNDIPGKNTFMPKEANFPPGALIPQLPFVEEELFCSGVVKYYNQPVALVVATSQEVVEKAAELVKVTYSPGKEPLLTIKQILDADAKDKIYHEGDLKAKRKGDDIKHVVKGSYETSWQYHFHMETQICIVVPKDDSLDVYPGTQWKDLIQVAISKLLNINENKINIFVKRVGGAYGAKVTRNSMIACAVALAAHKLQVPVRMRMSFTTNMDVIGKRYPSYANYEVGLNNEGEIQYLNHTFYLDYGAASSEAVAVGTMDMFYSSYKHDTWNVSANSTTSDNPPGTYTRAPGHINTMAMIESIMEHIAMELKISPWKIRMANMDKIENKHVIRFMEDVKEWSNYDDRLKQVQQFNMNNKWTKKGLSLVPMTFPLVPMGSYTSMVAIYAGDGTVAVTHGGIESGQGIDTKVAQVCAYALGISLDMVSVKRTNNIVAPNDFATARSTASEAVCYATLKSCQILLDRMKPVRDKMNNPTWTELVKKSQEQYVELVANYMYSPNEVQGYNIYGVCATEVEVDILTGVNQVTQVHLLEDTGNSMSPCVDVGQAEGAFIMGLGYWLTEKTVFTKNGKLLTNRTWNYKPPCAKDIPINFQVKFPKNNPNPLGVLGSKASGEPPLCLACSIPFAIRQAVASAREAANSNADKWYPIRGPSTVENTFMNSLNDFSQYTL